MKKILMAMCLLLFIAGFAAAQVGPGRALYVAVKAVPLKSSAGLFAGTVANLNYGDQVTVIRAEGKLVEVASAEDSSVSGWAALENFSTRRIIAGSASSVLASEVALAGKGFSQEVEGSYKAQGELNYADVDRVEALGADEAALARFIEEGRLSAGKQP